VCSSFLKKPNIPNIPDPIVVQPEEEKKIELNPLTKEVSSQKKRKKRGTKDLQIPLGGIGITTGLNIPGK